ncbi:SLAM family member 9-like isoform X3 [Mustela putorius furo]|uniref:SLAM family member 9-like isoform X3 n=1 Tax=Mustela putorius furo TaxID=9669 RepID=A0A8U0SH39_MUSPF|nr:SLAM family member 9-like isoform X3 [Mustela putorius furo]
MESLHLQEGVQPEAQGQHRSHTAQHVSSVSRSPAFCPPESCVQTAESVHAEPAGKQLAMLTCSEDPHLCGASWLLRFTSLLLSVCSAVTQSPGAHGSALDDSGNTVTLKGTQGASVLFLVIRNPELPPEFELEKMSWGVVSRSNYIVMLYVFPGRDVPEWVNFQEKFEKRVHVLNATTLRIDNLTLEDSGLYRARVSYTRGRQYDQDFHLTVYEPVPLPQIQAMDLSLTPGWCNITMECNTTGTREDLTVSWDSEGLPRELEQRPTPGPVPNPWTLAVTLPLSWPSPSLTCVVSNQVDQRTATLDLGDICGRDLHGPSLVALLRDILGTIVVILMILEAGLYLWMRRGKKKLESGRGAGLQEEPRDPDGGIHYADQTYQESGDRRDKGRGEPHLEEENSLTTVYSEVRRPGHAMTAF